MMHLIIHMFNTSMIPYISLDQYLNPNLYSISNMQNMRFFCCPVYMLQQNGKHFFKGLYVTFKLAPDLKKYIVYLSSYSLLKEGDVDILTNSMPRTYTSDIVERIILQ